MSRLGEALSCVELYAVMRQVFIFRFGVGNAGIHSFDALTAQLVFKGVLQYVSYASMPVLQVNIDGCLHSPVKCSALPKLMCVCIAQHLTLCVFGYEVGVAAADVGNTPTKLLHGRHIIFKRDGGMYHIRRIDSQQRRSIALQGFSYSNIISSRHYIIG